MVQLSLNEMSWLTFNLLAKEARPSPRKVAFPGESIDSCDIDCFTSGHLDIISACVSTPCARNSITISPVSYSVPFSDKSQKQLVTHNTTGIHQSLLAAS